MGVPPDGGAAVEASCPGDARDSIRRAEKVANAVLRHTRTKQEGDLIFQRLRDAAARLGALSELGLHADSIVSTDVDEAHRRCCLVWDMAMKRDIDILLQAVFEECGSMMDADRQFRSWQHKLAHGRAQVCGRTVSEEMLLEAQSRCQAYWAKITPGSVSIIVDNIAGKCPTWDSAEKKFDWLWKRGEWDGEGKRCKISGRVFSIEDLQQAERRCRKKFGLSGEISHRTPPVAAPPPAPSQTTSAPALVAEANAPAESRAADETTITEKATQPSARPDHQLSNEDFIVEHIMRKCQTMEQSKKFFSWLKSDTGKRIRGRTFVPEEVARAEARCREALEGGAKKASESSSSSSDSERQEPEEVVTPKVVVKEPEPQDANSALSSVDLIVQHVMSKCKTMEKAERIFHDLNETVGQRNFLGRICQQEEVTEAWLTVTAEFEAKAEAAKSETKQEKVVKPEKAAKKEKKEKRVKEVSESVIECAEKGSEGIVEYIMRKFSTMAQAEKCFEALHKTVGRPSKLGPVYTDEEITEAWLQCTQEFEQRTNQQLAPKVKEQLEKDEAKNSAKANLSNSDVIVRTVIRKCDTVNKSEKFFDMLHRTIGQPNPLGRIFSEEDVTEAWLRVTAYFEEKAAAGSSSDEGSESSQPTKLNAKTKDKKPKEEGKRKKGKKRRSKLVEDELEGALFGSDEDDDLSGEEQVDEEDENLGAALMADLGVGEDDELQVLDDNYPSHYWEEVAPEVLPGYEGFNSRATLVMQRAGLGQARLQVHFDTAAACPPLQPHQESVAFLMHPRSPVTRLLVDHPTGSGKTREMIKVLDNYFYDPRPKVPIFPKEPVCRNFYAELLRWPSRYRDYFCCERPADAAIASGRPDWKEFRLHMWDLSGLLESEVRRLVYSIRDVLEMKGMFHQGRVRRACRIAFQRKNPGESMMSAPLRALGYTSAGGSFSKIADGGKPLSCIMKIGFEKGSDNVYNNKIVIMDEAHNLVRSQSQYEDQLARLRTLLFRAGNLVLAGFTGTPILNEPSEGRQLLDIVKGHSAPEADDGYLSSFPMRPQPLFPLSLPRGLPDGVLTLQRKRQLVQKVEIHGETLKTYEWKKRIGLPPRRLRAYCNCCTYHGSFHEGRHGTKIRILTFPEDCCPKLHAIALAVAASPEKAIVMTSRMNGYIVMLELMKFIAARADPPFAVATMDELSEFNHVSNLRGEIFRVLVADAAQCSEGVSFLACRRTYLSDVPNSPSAFIQQCGRAIRMYGHRGLPMEEQTVTNQLYVATLPKWMRTSALGCWCLRAQKRYNSGKDVEKRARQLTGRFIRAGIKSLEDMKQRIDAHGKAKLEASGITYDDGRTKAASLSTEDVVSFLEQNGLWEEARMLRNAEKNQKEAKEKGLEHSLSRLDSTLSIDDTIDGAEPLDAPMDDALDGDTGIGNDGDDLAEALGEIIDDANAALSIKPSGGSSSTRDGAGGEPKGIKEAVAVVDAAAAAVEAAVGPPRKENKRETKEPLIDPELALEEAVAAIDVACDEMDHKGKKEGEAQVWRVKLEEVLLRLKASPNIANAAKTSIHPNFTIMDGTIRELSMEQVRLFRDELHRLWRVQVLTKAVACLKDVRSQIDAIQCSSVQVMGLDKALQFSPDVLEALNAEGVAISVSNNILPQSSPPTLIAAAANGFEDMANDADAENPPPSVDDSSCVAEKMTLPPQPFNDLQAEAERARAAEAAWRQALVDGLSTVKDEPLLAAAFKVAIRGYAKENDFIRRMTPEQVRRLHDEIVRLRTQEEHVPPRPRALVRAMQALYAAETVADAAATLSTETADELALRELIERSEEFAPALAGMRAMAIDTVIFEHLADKLHDDDDIAVSESEASDLVKDLDDKEPTPVVLPPGWRLEWVKRKKKEVKEFLDPEGNRYRSVRDVRIALLAWEARERAIALAAATAAAGEPPSKRTRLRAKVNAVDSAAASVYGVPAPQAEGGVDDVGDDLFGDGALERAFEEALDGAFEASRDTFTQADAERLARAPTKGGAPRPSKSFASLGPPSTKADQARKDASVRLKGLMAKPELNGQVGRLHAFVEETGRWECHLENGEKVNVKVANFDLVAAGNVPAAGGAKRPAPTPEAGGQPRPRTKGRAEPKVGGGKAQKSAEDVTLPVLSDDSD